MRDPKPPRQVPRRVPRTDPTRSARQIRQYEDKLVHLVKNYQAAVLKEVHRRVIREEKAGVPPVRLNTAGLKEMLGRIGHDQIEHPGTYVVNDEIPQAYNRGVVYSAIKLKVAGIDTSSRIMPPDQKAIELLKARNLNGYEKDGEIVGGLNNISADMSDAIMQTISGGLQNRDTLSDISRAIVANVDGIGINRATMLARTEIMNAVNTANVQRYQQAGVDQVEWLAAEDEKTCEECGDLDGQVFDIDGAPDCPAHPNCRCTLIPKIEIPGSSE